MSIDALATTGATAQPEKIRAGFNKACSLVAPTWPLDQLIAVNPLWELRQISYSEAAARLSALGNIRSHLSPDFYANSGAAGVAEFHLAQATAKFAADNLVAVPDSNPDEALLGHWMNIGDLLDAGRDEQKMSWHEEIVYQISQFCADSFRAEGPFSADAPGGSLYRHWQESIRSDRGVSILMAAPGLRQEFANLPTDKDVLFDLAAAELNLTENSAEPYAHALLLDINGWVSWAAYLRWQARLQGKDSDLTADLLAIRMAWELAIWRLNRNHRAAEFRQVQSVWQQQIAAPEALIQKHRKVQEKNWQWQVAAELAFQQRLAASLRDSGAPDQSVDEPQVQAVFCIDVRSEVLRRHLEAQNAGIQTRGFAGFFGLPVQLRFTESGFNRPQLPGLLAPDLSMCADSKSHRADRNKAKTSWLKTADSPAAMFGLVEASGLYYLWKLLRDSFYPAAASDPAGSLAAAETIELVRDDQPVGLDERIELAAGVLHAMGLEEDFAPIVLVVGHGAESPNNPQAASLNCGACGGQSGELNSQVLAKLLNDPAVRKGLFSRGIQIPLRTQFVACLHETVTDDLRVVDGSELSAEVSAWLRGASVATRRERAARLDLEFDSDAALGKALKRRARDWSQVRPEWGLAGNAAFIVAPRDRTRGIDLQGRAFLHDYDWQKDPDLSVLELIMTAPMVVTHWINMQYNASVVDNERYGSGNKVLHNVVGGNVGVFEGNGGDLRIGLPMQSVHDGDKWMHVPLRLSVYIEAPAEAIKTIYQRHEVVRQLVDNDWLYLFRLDDAGHCRQLYQDDWIESGSH